MCTVSFTYDAHNMQAQRMVDQLRESGLFKENTPKKRLRNRRYSEETEAFIFTSRHNAAKMFSAKI